MSTTFGGTRISRSRAKSRGRGPGRYTQARRAAREDARKRTVRHQMLQAHKTLRSDGLAGARAARWPFVTMFAIIAAGAVIALLMLNTATAQTSFVQSKLKSKLNSLTVKQQSLEEQVSNKESPIYLAQKAAALGLVPGGQPGYLVINPDGTSKFVEPDPKKAGSNPGAEPVPSDADPENPASGATVPGGATAPPSQAPSAPGAGQ